MCQLDDDFLLCACDEAELTDPDWILERRDPAREPFRRRGRAMVPRFSAREQTMQAVAIAGLSRGCFDFDYAPVDGDVLRLRLSGKWYRFRYSREAWEADRSTSLTGWRGQMVAMQKGKLGEKQQATSNNAGSPDRES